MPKLISTVVNTTQVSLSLPNCQTFCTSYNCKLSNENNFCTPWIPNYIVRKKNFVLSPGKGEVKPAKQVQVPRQDDTCVWAVIDPLWLQVIPWKESMALCWSVHYLQAPHPLPLQCIWQYSLQHLTWVDGHSLSGISLKARRNPFSVPTPRAKIMLTLTHFLLGMCSRGFPSEGLLSEVSNRASLRICLFCIK